MQNDYDYAKHLALLQAELEICYDYISKSKAAAAEGRGEGPVVWLSKWDHYMKLLGMHERLSTKAGASLRSDDDDSLFVRG